MEIVPNCSLRDHNTFRVEAKTKWWVAYRGLEDLEKFLQDGRFKSLPFISLGLGANTLFVDNYEGVVLHSKITSIEEVRKVNPLSEGEYFSTRWFRVGSGVLWDDFVAKTIDRGFYGLENLSGIPASVGAAIVQNIGAYGSEVGKFVEEIEAFDLARGKKIRLQGSQAQFGYRYSIFKTPPFANVVITHVTFRLSRQSHPNLSYATLAEAFASVESPTAPEVRRKVLTIRRSKLPSVDVFPNAGSFFKNPLVSQEMFEFLQREYPSMPHWFSPYVDSRVKLSAAWLIEQVGYKGKRERNVGCYSLQPLVIVNYGTSSGKEIVQFAHKVKQAVEKQFGVELVPEVRFIETPKQKV